MKKRDNLYTCSRYDKKFFDSKKTAMQSSFGLQHSFSVAIKEWQERVLSSATTYNITSDHLSLALFVHYYQLLILVQDIIRLKSLGIALFA